MRDEARRAKTGGSGANTVAVVYEPALTLDLPREETVGTAMNALAHCAEALYAGPCEDASTGAALIARWLPRVVADGRDLEARTRLLEGAMHAGMALAERGLFLAHAMAQALGGRYGASHGALNALCLAPALRFNEPVVPDAIAALATRAGSRRTRRRGSRSSRGSAASSDSATSASRRTSSPSVAAETAAAARRTLESAAGDARRTSRRCSARSGESLTNRPRGRTM